MKELENCVDSDTDEPQRQHQQPDDRIQEQSQQRQRPTHHQQNQPQDEGPHILLHPSVRTTKRRSSRAHRHVGAPSEVWSNGSTHPMLHAGFRLRARLRLHARFESSASTGELRQRNAVVQGQLQQTVAATGISGSLSGQPGQQSSRFERVEIPDPIRVRAAGGMSGTEKETETETTGDQAGG
jgi:hypothetical protein